MSQRDLAARVFEVVKSAYAPSPCSLEQKFIQLKAI